MKKKIAMLMVILGVLGYSGVIGEIREVDGKRYVMPYSRESDAFPRINKEGVQYRKAYINDRDNSDEIIVYSDFDDAPAKHCRRKKGHSVLREDSLNGEMVRMCRLDTPGARVEGSKMEVEEVEYYVANTENKYLWEKLIEDKKMDPEDKVFSDEAYTAYAKYTRPQKKAEIIKRYLEPKEEVQQYLRELFRKKYEEQYGSKGLRFESYYSLIEKR